MTVESSFSSTVADILAKTFIFIFTESAVKFPESVQTSVINLVPVDGLI